MWLARDRFTPGEPDRVIAIAASQHRATVVTWNLRHFRALAKRKKQDGTLSYPGMSVLSFRCPESRGLQRLKEVIQEVEAVHAIRVEQASGRMVAEIASTVLRFED